LSVYCGRAFTPWLFPEFVKPGYSARQGGPVLDRDHPVGMLNTPAMKDVLLLKEKKASPGEIIPGGDFRFTIVQGAVRFI